LQVRMVHTSCENGHTFISSSSKFTFVRTNIYDVLSVEIRWRECDVKGAKKMKN